MIAVAVLSCLTALARLRRAPLGAASRGGARRRAGLRGRLLLCPGSLQGDDAGALRPRLRPRRARGGGNGSWREAPLRFVPAALVAAGSVYIYGYPGLAWLAAAAALWHGAWLPSRRRREPGRPAPWRSALLAALAFLILVAPELGRMVEFRNFETFDPNGPGLGNLFGQVSPFEALGIWPSGDFRLAPGDGAVPALGYYLGAAFGAILLLYGAAALLAPPGDARARGPGGGRRRLRSGQGGGHPLHGGQGDRGRRADRRPRHPPAPAAPSGGPPIPARRRWLLAAGAGQRARRPERLLAGADRAPPAGGCRLDPGARLRPPARGRTGRALRRLGAARRPGLRRLRLRSRRGRRRREEAPGRRPLRRLPKAGQGGRPTGACACAATPIPICSGKPARAPDAQAGAP